MNRFSPILLNYLNQYAQNNYIQHALGTFVDIVIPDTFIPNKKRYHLFVNIMDEIGKFDNKIGLPSYTENIFTLLCFLIAMDNADIDAFVEEVSSPGYGDNVK